VKLRDMRQVPVLEGWITLPEAAEDLGISRARVHQMAQEEKLTTVSQLGRRPVYIVREVEIRRIKEERQAGRVVAVAVETPQYVIGGVLVSRDQLERAIAILNATQGTRGSLKQALLKDVNPLARSDYMGVAKVYKASHTAARGLSTKQVLLAAYSEALAGTESLLAVG
jgi:hypothetical protein